MKRISFADGLRICAAFMVILLHVSAQYWSSTPVTSSAWKVYNLFDSLARPAVPIFVMLSGMLLLDPQRDITLRDVFTKYCKRIVLVWIFWSLFYATWSDVLWNALRHLEIDWAYVTRAFWAGHYHLWYCKMLLGLYLILPFLREFVKKKGLTEYFLLLTLCLTVILPNLPWEWAQLLRQNTYFYFTAGFVGYFLLGYYLRQTRLPRGMRYGIYALGIGSLLWTVVANLRRSLAADAAYGYFDPWMPNIVLMTVAVFVFFQYAMNPLLERYSRFLESVSPYMFGVYLVHPFVMTILENMGFSILAYPAYLSVPCFTVLVFLLSCCCSWLLRKIPFLGKRIC